MTDRTCATCFFWARLADGRATGTCRRHAPQPLLLPLAGGEDPPTTAVLVEPRRDAGDWCGEHTPLPRGNVDAERAALEREVVELRGELQRARDTINGRGGYG